MADQDLDILRGAISELQAGFNKLTTSAGGASTALGGMISTLGQGKSSLDTYSSLMDQAAKGVGSFAKAVPLAGSAVAGGLNLMSASLGKTLETSDRLNKTYSTAASSGLALGESLTQMADRGAKFGLAIGLNEQQAQLYGKVLVQNSNSLARLGGTAQQGALRMEDTFAATGRFRIGLQNLGVSYEDQIEGVGDYLRLQTTLGLAQKQTNDQLAVGAKNYLVEMQGLAAITGQNRQEMQKQRETALGEQKFRAQYELQLRKAAQLEAQGRTEEAAALRKGAQGLLTLDNIVASADKELAKGFRDLSTGMVNSPEAQKAIMATGGAGQEIMRQLKQGIISPVEAAQKLSQAVGKTTDRMLPLAAASDSYGKTFGNLSDQLKFSQLSQNDVVKQATEFERKQMAVAKDTASEQARANSASNKARFVNIGAQDAVVGMQDAALDAANKLGDLGLQYVPQLADEFKKLTTQVTGVIKTSKSFEDAMRRLADLASTGIAGGPAAKPGSAEDRGMGGAASRVLNDISRAVTGNRGGAAPSTGQNNGAPVTGAAPTPGGLTAQQRTQLEGLSIKKGALAEGAPLSQKVIDAARAIQESFPGAKFTSFNDPVKGRSANSAHSTGNAVDIVVPAAQAATLKKLLNTLGAKKVVDEIRAPANPAAAASWGPHIHAEFAQGGISSGPKTGYAAMLHGLEAIVPLPNNKKIPVEIKMPQLGMPNQPFGGSDAPQMQGIEKSLSAMADNLKTAMSTQGGSMDPLISLLTEMVNGQKTQNATMAKLLQVSRS